MTAAVWLAAAVVGLGSVLVFALFLLDLGAVLPPRPRRPGAGAQRRGWRKRSQRGRK